MMDVTTPGQSTSAEPQTLKPNSDVARRAQANGLVGYDMTLWTDEYVTQLIAQREAESLAWRDLLTSLNGGNVMSDIKIEMMNALFLQKEHGYSFTLGELKGLYADVESFIASVELQFGGSLPPGVQTMLSTARLLLNDLFQTAQSVRTDEPLDQRNLFSQSLLD